MAGAWTIVRPPTVYGEWDREVLKAFKLARMGVAPVFGDGSQELSVIYAGDLAAALVAAATTPATANRVYYAAHPVVTTSRDLVRAIGRAVGREPRIVPLPESWRGASCGRSGRLRTSRAGRHSCRAIKRPNFWPRPGRAAPTR